MQTCMFYLTIHTHAVSPATAAAIWWIVYNYFLRCFKFLYFWLASWMLCLSDNLHCNWHNNGITVSCPKPLGLSRRGIRYKVIVQPLPRCPDLCLPAYHCLKGVIMCTWIPDTTDPVFCQSSGILSRHFYVRFQGVFYFSTHSITNVCLITRWLSGHSCLVFFITPK